MRATTGLSDGLIARSMTTALSARSSRLGQRTGAPYAEYRDDPVAHLTEVQGWRPWDSSDSPTGAPGQREILEALQRDRRVTVVTGNGYGKTSLVARIVLWFMSTRTNAIMLGVMPTWKQVVMQQWAHIREAYNRSAKPMPGKPDTFKWSLGPLWFAHGFSTDNEDNFQGFHAVTDDDGDVGDLLIVVDEAGGVEEFAFNAIRGFLTRGNCYVLLVGNGNCEGGTYYASHHTLKTYTRFQASAYDCPEWIISREWIKEREDELDAGEITQDQFDIRVLGGFRTRGGKKQLIPRMLLEKTKDIKPNDHDEKHMGVDVARHGDDLNVATLTEGERVVHVESWSGDDLTETAKNLIVLASEWGVEAHRIHVDIGMGAGVIDRMKEAGWIVDSVDLGAKPKGDWKKVVGAKQKFLNRRAELHWVARQLLMKGKASIPAKFRKTWQQAQWLEFDFKEGTDVLFIISKKDLAKKLAKRGIAAASPDFWDSWMLSLSRAKAGKLAVLVR